MIEPSSQSGFYQFLRRKHISEKNVAKRLQSWSSSEVMEFIQEAHWLLSMGLTEAKSLFSFTANASLSGAPFPCASIDCRMAKLDSLARFAALYADQVYVVNPFERYVFDRHIAENLEKEPSAEFIRHALTGDILGLLHLRPLLEAGILSVYSNLMALCAECEAELETLEAMTREQFEKAERQLQKRYRQETKIEIIHSDDEIFLRVTGPEYLVEHRTMDFVGRLPQGLLENYDIGKNRVLKKKELREYDVLGWLTRPIVADIFEQNVHVHLSKSQYLTHREIDFDIVNSTGIASVIRSSEALVHGLTHSIPTIEETPINRLIDLRQKEGEAFEVYRDSIGRVLKQAQTLDRKAIAELVDDEVRPQIHKIERSIKNSRRLVVQSLRREVMVGAGYLTAGIFAGFLSVDAAAVVTALGGYRFVSSMADQFSSLRDPSNGVQEDPYYFLWKVSDLRKQI